MQDRVTRLAFVLLALASTGCTTANKRLYEGPPRERSEVAVLKVQWKATGNSARIHTIDGKPVEKGRAFALTFRLVKSISH